jgi:hypothetical protein
VAKALDVAREYSSRNKRGNALRLARGEVLSDRYPTQYLPEVGRQVMADGGVLAPNLFRRTKKKGGSVVERALMVVSKKA